MKPRMKYDRGMKMWFCGGLFSPPHYIDWFSGQTMEQAYLNWKSGFGVYG